MINKNLRSSSLSALQICAEGRPLEWSSSILLFQSRDLFLNFEFVFYLGSTFRYRSWHPAPQICCSFFVFRCSIVPGFSFRSRIDVWASPFAFLIFFPSYFFSGPLCWRRPDVIGILRKDKLGHKIVILGFLDPCIRRSGHEGL